MKTVRSRATEFTDTLHIQQIKELPLDQAKDRFSLILDIWDRATIKAYFGVQAHKTRRKIERFAVYSTGTPSIKRIELSQDVAYCKGYLEKFGLVHFEHRGKNWFMVLENCPIIPEIVKAGNENEKSIVNFSLTSKQANHNDNGEGLGRETNLPRALLLQDGVGCPSVVDGQKRERDYRCRERNRSGESEGILKHTKAYSETSFATSSDEQLLREVKAADLCTDVERLIKAEPTAAPDKAKVSWGVQE